MTPTLRENPAWRSGRGFCVLELVPSGTPKSTKVYFLYNIIIYFFCKGLPRCERLCVAAPALGMVEFAMDSPHLEEVSMANSQLGITADRMTLQSLQKVKEGLSASINDLLLMIAKDKNESVGRGWHELHSGEGEVVAEDDDFFESVSNEIRERPGHASGGD